MNINNFEQVGKKSNANKTCVGGLGNHFGHLNWQLASNGNCLCDGMDNCHLTTFHDKYKILQSTLPTTSFSRELFLVNQYVPSHFPIEFQTVSNDIYEGTFYRHGIVPSTTQLPYYNESNYTGDVSPIISNIFNRQEFSRLFDFNRSQLNLMHDYSLKEKLFHSSDSLQNINKNVKFQNKTKKLDFKINFKEENHKINGCFYDQESKTVPEEHLPVDSCAFLLQKKIAPPKKKWMTNFINGNYRALDNLR